MNPTLAASIAFVLTGIAMVLVAVTVLAGWPWALLIAAVVLVYAGYVLSTKVPAQRRGGGR